MRDDRTYESLRVSKKVGIARAFFPTYHETKRNEGERRDGTAEPKHLAVSDEDDCQVFEDGVHGDGEVLLRGPGSVSMLMLLQRL